MDKLDYFLDGVAIFICFILVVFGLTYVVAMFVTLGAMVVWYRVTGLPELDLNCVF